MTAIERYIGLKYTLTIIALGLGAAAVLVYIGVLVYEAWKNRKR